MLQQTRVETAIPYYRRFVAALAHARGAGRVPDDDEVLAAWSGLGYYARCRNLLAAARQARARHGGLPASLEALRGLPGFGPYTAGAVASIAFAIPGGGRRRQRGPGPLAPLPRGRRPRSPTVKRGLEALADVLVDRRRPGDLNQALMELGAIVCRPRRPDCANCPLAAVLRGVPGGTGRPTFPASRARRRPSRVVLALLRVERGGRLLLSRAPDGGLFAGMWGLPGLEVPRGVGPGRVRSSSGAAGSSGARLEVGQRNRHGRPGPHPPPPRVPGPRGEAGRGVAGPVREPLRFTTEGEASRLPASTAMRRAIEASGGWMFASRRDRRDAKNVATE